MTRESGGSSTPAGYTGGMRTWVRVGVVLVGGLLLAGAAAFVAVVPPTAGSFYPKCEFHQLTGLHCPGCGLTRSAHHLLTGRPLQAVGDNLFGPLALVWLGWEAGRRGRARLRGRPDPGWWVRADWVPWLLGALALFTVLRNVPAWPLTLLAPQPLG